MSSILVCFPLKIRLTIAAFVLVGPGQLRNRIGPVNSRGHSSNFLIGERRVATKPLINFYLNQITESPSRASRDPKN